MSHILSTFKGLYSVLILGEGDKVLREAGPHLRPVVRGLACRLRDLGPRV